MSDNYYGPDDPTQRIEPDQPHNQPGQGKLVLGNFQNDPAPRPTQQRRPYQYQSPAQQPPAAQPQPHAQQRNPQPAPMRPEQPVQRNAGGTSMPQTPYAPPTPHQQPGNVPAGTFSPAPARPVVRRSSRRRKGCAIGCLSVLALVILLGAFVITTTQRVLAFGSAISPKSPLSTDTNYMNTSDRTNMLIMGYGGSGHDGALLTDSLLIVSMIPQTQHTTLVSVPRDLWVRVTMNPDNYGKINSLYEVASNNGKDGIAGGNAVAQKMSVITGLNVKYWMTIDFNGFRKLIDSIGGVDVYVPDSFSAKYPKNDDPNVDASWIIVKFTKGQQHMNGEKAIEYARAREAIDNLSEGTDFARSARQQIIVKAVLAKVKQMSTWPKLFDAMTALQKTIYTNMSLADLGLFSEKLNLNDPHTSRVGLSTSNVLEEDNYFNLHPINNDWTQISNYVKSKLYN